jgi:RHS repeat-associated protein
MTHQKKKKHSDRAHKLLSAGLMLLAGLTAVSARAQLPTDPYNYSRASAFEYDDTTGLLKTETVEPDNSNLCATTSYQYDAYGNKTSATTANCANASGRALFDPRVSSTTYGAQTGAATPAPAGTFPTVATNALNKSETKVLDPRFGVVTSLTGPNGLTTTWELDDFGRVVHESRADGTSTVTAYCFLSGVDDASSNSDMCSALSTADAPDGAVSFVQSEPRDVSGKKNGPFTRVYVDRAGRKLRTVTESFDGAVPSGGSPRLIAQDTEYNAQGVAIVTTQPYFLDTKSSLSSGSTGYGMTRTDYDSLGRPVAVYVADGQGSQAGVPFGSHGSAQASVTTINYTGLTTTTVNDKGQLRTEEKDANGQLARVTDAYGAQVAYQHDAFGNLIATKDALQNITTITYDIRGRKVSLTDPDAGTTQYDYDALGELVWQQSANQAAAGQATTLAYDLLGRLTQRVEPEYTSTWSYDSYADGSACNKGVGKLCETNTTNGINKKFVYDDLGRPINTRTSVANGPSFATAVSYDSNNGRLVSQTWPTGLAVNYSYTTNGFLNTVTLAQAATVNPLPATAGGTPGPSVTLAAGSLLWQAQAYNAWGRAEQFIYGNNVVSKASFDAQTGRVLSQAAGTGTATEVMNYSYVYDSLNHLTSRTDANGDGTTGAVTDSFAYDSIGRLQSYTVNAPAIPNLARTVNLQYNALGMVLYKDDVGAYSYPAQGGAHPHALQSVAGAFSASYTYDANGNVTAATNGAWRSVAYTSFNLPDSQNGVQGPSGGPQYLWQYDENHQRIKESRTNASGTRTTWELHPDNVGGLSFESEQASDGTTSNRHYISAGGQMIGVLVGTGALPSLAAGQTAPPAVSSLTLVKVEYWHQDHLGSLAATTDHTGAVTARYSYDPFGKRRYTNGNYDANGNLVVDWSTDTNNGDDRGWTGHEHLDDVGIVHMNGRLFDPRLGRFMQADPYVQNPGNLQNFNRYAYCYNNPMTCTDPSGHLFDGLIDVPVIDNLWNNHIKPYAPVLASIAISIYLPGANGFLATEMGITNGLTQAAITGFVSGSVASGNLKGGLQGMATAMMFYGVGSGITDYMDKNGTITDAVKFGEAIAVHGVVGCVSNVMSGGKCGPGALSAAFTKAMTPTVASMTGADRLTGTLVSAAVGGTGSVLGGGKFANGAMTGAYSYLMNGWIHVVQGKIAQDVLYEEKLRAMGFDTEVQTDVGRADFVENGVGVGELKPITHMDDDGKYIEDLRQLSKYENALDLGQLDWKGTLGVSTLTLSRRYFGLTISFTYEVDPKGSGLLFYEPSVHPLSLDYSWLRQLNRMPRKGSGSVDPVFGAPVPLVPPPLMLPVP